MEQALHASLVDNPAIGEDAALEQALRASLQDYKWM